jgi:hypothetical protein
LPATVQVWGMRVSHTPNTSTARFWIGRPGANRFRCGHLYGDPRPPDQVRGRPGGISELAGSIPRLSGRADEGRLPCHFGPKFTPWPGLSRGPSAHGLDPWASMSSKPRGPVAKTWVPGTSPGTGKYFWL